MKKLIVFVSFFLILTASFAQSFKTGDKVEIYNSGVWYKGSILQAGTGNYNGYYYVHYDGYSTDQWIKASNIKLVKSSAATTNIDNGPRNGTYTILSYNNPSNPIRIGYFQLNNGQYTYYNAAKHVIGKGGFTYNKKNKTVQWISGPFKDAKWNGGFEIDREGKTDKIRLNNVTIGSNSTDSK